MPKAKKSFTPQPRINKDGVVVSYQFRSFGGVHEGKRLKDKSHSVKVPQSYFCDGKQYAVTTRAQTFTETLPDGTKRTSFKRDKDGNYVITCKDSRGISFLKDLQLWVKQQQDIFEGKAAANVDFSKTFYSLCDRYIESQRGQLSPATYKATAQIIEREIKPYFGNCPIDDITPEMVQGYIDYLKNRDNLRKDGDKLTPETIRRYFTILKLVFSFHCGLNVNAYNPTLAKFKKPRKVDEDSDITVISNEDFDRIRAALEVEQDLQKRTFFTLALGTGMRRGELVALRFSDIDIAAKEMTVQRNVDSTGYIKGTKSGKPRTIPLRDDCLALIEQLRERNATERKRIGSQWATYDDGKPCDYVFANDSGNHYYTQTPYVWWCDMLESHSIQHYKLHSTRHTYAVRCLQIGKLDIATVRDLLGHSSVAITNRYLKFIPDDIEKEKRRLAVNAI